jgi:hypothetical protein
MPASFQLMKSNVNWPLNYIGAGRTHGSFHAMSTPMKAVDEFGRKHTFEYYTSTIAPIGCRLEVQFRAMDAIVLSVLFLEVLGVMRLLLAN